MDKKKIIKICLVVLILIILIFLIDLGRKTYILNKYSNKCEEYLKVTNFYVKKGQEEGITSELWRKDNLAFLKITQDDATRMIHWGEDYNWIIIDSKDGKTAVKMTKEGGGAEIQTLVSGTLSLDNFWNTIQLAFLSRISSEKINDIDCYKIFINEDWQMFIDKKDFLLIREINGSTDTGIIEYEFNNVKDEEVTMPNLAGYKIKDTTQK